MRVDSGTEHRRHAHRTRREIGRVGAVAIAIVAASAAGFVTAFAHHIVSTTPMPASGVVGKTALADTAIVDADSSRHVAFSLWAPGTCGTVGATPVFTDSEAVTSSTVTDSSVTSATYVPQQTGVYEWTAEVVVNADGSVEGSPTACSDEQVTINKVATHIGTTPSNAGGAPVGTSITDAAAVSGGLDPTGTVTFFLYGPDNTGCVSSEGNSWLQRWVVSLSADGTARVPGPGYTTTTAGHYNWVANFSGDSNNMPAHSNCGDETVDIGKASPTIVTTASTGGPVGSKIHDTAQVSGGVNPTGTVTFFLYPPSNPTCANNDSPGFVQKVTVALGSNGSATSAGTPYTTKEIGVYNWIATYSGDANNNGASTRCSDEQVTIGKDPTSVTTVPSAGGVVGTAIHDTAKVTGPFLPTGTVTFNLYGPADATCTAAAIFTSKTALDASGNATSAAFKATTVAGTYNWIAIYSGDERSAGSRSKCGDEKVVIKPTGGTQGITTPGTGAGSDMTQLGIGVEILLLGLAFGLGGELVREVRRR